MSTERYNLSFIGGGLLHRESVKLAELYLGLGDWDAVRERVKVENILQTRTLNTLKRISCEIVSRLQALNQVELELFVGSSSQEQAYLLWLAICRRYRFIAEFAVEVLRERYITLKADLTYEDFNTFLNRKSEWHSELDEVAPSTKYKLRQILFKILREAELLTTKNIINGALLSPRLLDFLYRRNPREVLYFPLFGSELKVKEKCQTI
ncbi:DUF1819 family protein [Legionella pneumophila]|uniref:DUF1819 family protein n=1 Tax=Legionella pneumophila TaxID=446 RepID=UPI00077073E3|nr:DUF1819 family protein [Legionella pneumophila]CZJ15794.1 Putative inner membrane protein (DUF1819) [Legionella pneumophila]CZJ26888.1 Putative inner membrane protein (DUF1819) [Legionella pneumophila]CZJ27213.1 Putative inner membrane protein (DUF1819) [Legionella pneumophila]CZJ28993.1 Putative inner membrane protein (DUF1819) [Legionella pneumophila]CZJ31748.1 Putative inner membrane protein (DUF1819) [Legionella pneumophila]